MKNQYIQYKLLTLSVVCAGAMLVCASPANAAMATVICMVLGIVQGALGAAVATMGVLAASIGAAMGKVSWGLAITVAMGISLLFQASWYAAQFGVGGGC